MNLLDAPWIGKAVGIAVLAGFFALLWISHKLDKKGLLKNYSRGLGRGLFEVETMLRPSKQHVRQVKEETRPVEDDQAGSDPEPRSLA